MYFKILFRFAVLLITPLSAFCQTFQNLENIKSVADGATVRLPDIHNAEFSEINYNKLVLPGPQFIISDDPEYIKEKEAIALQENIQPGLVRLYLYNVNGVENPKISRKISAILTNKGKEDMNFKILKSSSQSPSTNYYKLGKETLAHFFSSDHKVSAKTIKPGESVAIDSLFENSIVKYNELAHGFYEFLVDQRGMISIVQTDPDTPGAKLINSETQILSSSKQSGAGRGKFGVSNYLITNDGPIIFDDEPKQLIIADGEKDHWIEGIDGSTGEIAKLAGNYGVIYEIDLNIHIPKNRDLALVTFNSRAANNRWCGGMALSIVVDPEKDSENVIMVPSDKLALKGPPDAAVIKVFKNEGNDLQSIRFNYSPPGASCLPTPLIFVPIPK